MCKVLIIPAIKDNKRKETNSFISVMGELMSKHNTDGLGYAAIDKDGNLFSERWFNNHHFQYRPTADDTNGVDDKKIKSDAVFNMWGKAIKSFGGKEARLFTSPTSQNYNKFGEGNFEKHARAITLHTRMATCDKTLANVHPFIDKDTSVIHNGVINNSKQFDLKLSTCDSESILISYLNAGVSSALDKIKDMTERLYGYYACGVFARDAAGVRILDVFKGNHANLSLAFIFELDTYILTTSEYDIKEACEALGYTHGGIKEVESDVVTRINPFNGAVISQAEFKANLGYWNEHKNDYNRHTPKSYSNNISNLPIRSKQFSKEMIAMMQLHPQIKMYTDHETYEFETKLTMGAY
jgi:predicted glutamine amidotransferase